MSFEEVVTPWQYHWKRPAYWETPNAIFSPTRTRVIDHAAAVVELEEDSLLLTVTLIGEQTVGDRVVLSLTDPETKECVKSRTLQWPTSEDTTSNRSNLDEHQLVSPFAHREVISCAGDAAGPLLQTLGVLFNKPDLVVAANTSTSSIVVPASPGDDHDDGDTLDAIPVRQKTRLLHGLVAAVLLRFSKQTQSAEQSDAMEVLNFLSLSSPKPQTTEQASIEATASSRELVLVLLTSSGQVHVYDPTDLLDESSSKRNQDLPEMENAMTHFVFGSDLVATLQSHILPLSQPDKTLQISVLGSKNRKNDWDPTIERNTLAFFEPGGPWRALSLVRTQNNAMAVIANNDYTGAVTLVSSSSWTEKRTIFVPIPIRSAQAVSWGPLSLLVLVLEEEMVVAISMTSVNVVAGKTPLETATQADQKTISIARYQILLVEVPILSAQNEVAVMNTEREDLTPACVVSTRYQHSQYTWTSIDTTLAKPNSFFYYNGDERMVVIHSQLERQARLASKTRTLSFLGEGYGVTGNSESLSYIGWEGNANVHELAPIQLQKLSPVIPMDKVSTTPEVSPPSVVAVPEGGEHLVEEAMQSISQQALRQKSASPSRSSFTLREKARRLSKSVKCDPNPYNDINQVTALVTDQGKLGFVAIRNAPTPAPFLAVASWLMNERQDYLTAASITLQKAGAMESFHLLVGEDRDMVDCADSLLEGLQSEDAPNAIADYAVASLIAGKYSDILEQFLERNELYHPGRASLQLAAASARAIDHNDGDLWPVRCLLTVGKARDYLPTTLQLLNRTLPQELRDGSLVCHGLVSWIVSAGALVLLLDLTDEKSSQRYWKSIEADTQRGLVVLNIGDRYPLLVDPEIRQWVLSELAASVSNEMVGSHSVDLLTTDWLEKLIRACFLNAGCGMEQLGTGVGDEVDNVRLTREGLLPAVGSGGLDFGIVIPALLVLQRRLYDMPDLQRTRVLLNAACYLAGRRNVEEPRFPLNGTALMRQCTVVGDVEAGANLIGGKNGLILECCHVLMIEIGLSMDEAEAYLLSDASELPGDNRDVIEAFSIGPSHQRILRLLQEHVLSIRTYGEFETTHVRGRVDPVFAASLCLKTWWSITSETLPEASEWLVDWLQHELQMKDGSTSPYRLVCAALVRALLWPESHDSSPNDLLASKMQLRSIFLIQLSQSCCGLVESLPPYVSDSNWTHSPTPNRPVVSDPFNESFISASGSL